MKFTILLSVLFTISFLDYQSEFVFEKKLEYKADFIAVDKLGFLYLVNSTGIKKIDLENKIEENYSNILFGKINTIDISDSFKTLIFYKEFNKVEFLNKNFTSIGSPIQLDDLAYYNVLSVCQSASGGFWIFDQSLSQLLYIDSNRKTLNRSSQLTGLLGQNIDQKQVYMLEKNDYIYLGIEGEGILLFDSYGTYIKTFPLHNAGIFQVNNEIISYNFNGELYFYDTKDFTERSMILPKHECEQVLVEKGRLFVKTKKNVFIYKLNN